MSDQVIFIEDLNWQAQTQKAPQAQGQITAVAKRSAAAKLGIQVGDGLVSINGQACQDVIDVQYHAAEAWLEIVVERDGQLLTLTGPRKGGQELGLSFKHPTFDIDIRRCNNLCPFCFVLQMGPRFRRTLYIKDDDYRYSFLFGHYVTLTNLSDHDWQRIQEQHLSPLYVSVHATDIEKRRECLRNPSAPDIVAQLRQLAAQGFEVHTQMVITPGMNDGIHLERSLQDLFELYPTVASISVVPVGLTQFHKYGHHAASVEQAQQVLDTVERWQQIALEHFGLRLVYCTDEYYLVAGRPFPALNDYDGLSLRENGLGMVRAFLDEWHTVQHSELTKLKDHTTSLTLVTGTLAAPVIHQAAQELQSATGIQADVVAVVNQRLGKGITVAGLLMGQDVIEALQDRPLGQVIVLPRIMFDHPDGVSLDDVAPWQIAQAVGRPVALADWMGDVVDVLLGQNKLLFSPDDLPRVSEDIAQDGGWAVEKYL
jgi:putative radical SAM enzyme (TIGR03279 family)